MREWMSWSDFARSVTPRSRLTCSAIVLKACTVTTEGSRAWPCQCCLRVPRMKRGSWTRNDLCGLRGLMLHEQTKHDLNLCRAYTSCNGRNVLVLIFIITEISCMPTSITGPEMQTRRSLYNVIITPDGVAASLLRC